MAIAAHKTFLITGVSSGLGRAFAEGALHAGHRVIGTVRRTGDAEAFAAFAPDRAHPLVLDVTDNCRRHKLVTALDLLGAEGWDAGGAHVETLDEDVSVFEQTFRQ